MPTPGTKPAPTTETVSISRIVKSTRYTRSLPPKEKFDQFVESIKSTGGPKQPPRVRPVPGSDKLEIVTGYMRWQAALRAGLKTLQVTIEQMTDLKADEWMAKENLDRFDPIAVETAEQLLKWSDTLIASLPASKRLSYHSDRQRAQFLHPHMSGRTPDTIRGMLAALPMDPANRERLRECRATFEHIRKARQLLSRTEIATAEQERWWVDLVVEAMQERWSVKEMWRAGESRYRVRNQLPIHSSMPIPTWEPPKHKYDVCRTCGEPWGTHLCPWKGFQNPDVPTATKLAEMFAAQFPKAAAALVTLVAAKKVTLAEGTTPPPPAPGGSTLHGIRQARPAAAKRAKASATRS